MSSGGLSDLLSRASKLSSSVTGANTQQTDVPQIERNLTQVFEQGERLWRKTAADRRTDDHTPSKRKSPSLDLQTSLMLGAEPVSIPRISKRLEELSNVQSSEKDTMVETDLETFLRQRRELMLMNLVDETLNTTQEEAERLHWRRLMSEWSEAKQRTIQGIPSVNVAQMVPQPKTHTAAIQRSTLGAVQLAFAQQVHEYTSKVVQGGVEPNLSQMFTKAVRQLPDQGYQSVWDQVSSILSIKPNSSEDLLKTRTSPQFRLEIVRKSLGYLEKQFKDHMDMMVYGSLAQAKRGGTPGTVALVQAYLNVKMPAGYTGSEDGCLDSRHPTWSLLYHCIRAGDFSSALDLCNKRPIPALSEVISALTELTKRPDHRLAPDTETKLKMEYRRRVRASSDFYKRAVYCVLGNCDLLAEHSQVADKLEDWLWMRLTQAKHGELLGTITQEHTNLVTLQKQIIQDYGEHHFSGGDCPLLYFSALWLSGQFEAAIEFLSRQGDTLRCHATHIALATHQTGLLVTPKDTRAKLCTSEREDILSKRLNLVRLVLLYTSSFECSDVREALNYMYLLRSFKDPSGENMLTSTVSRLVRETKEYEMMLGIIQPDGTRKPGLIDALKIDSKALIDFVAAESAASGDAEAAVALYDLAGNHSQVLSLLNSSLSQLISLPNVSGSQRERVLGLGVTVGKRYRQLGYQAEEAIASVFFLLLDLATFFDLWHAQRMVEALEVIRKLQVVPLHPDQVDQYVRMFHMIPEEVRRVLSDILLAVMDIIHNQYKSAKEKNVNAAFGIVDQSIEEVRLEAKSLILYAGMIPYVLPADTNARLVHIQAQMQ